MFSRPLRPYLERSHPVIIALLATLAAFCTYSCMYAFRKAFTAAGYADEPMLWGLKFKTAIVIAQVLGYTFSKFVGIKVIAEMGSRRRALSILLLIGVAQLALLLFGIIPSPYNFWCLFLNGIPLGMIWGLVFSYLEGRRFTEVMGLGLSASFIFASGFVKDVGKRLLKEGVPDVWMPVLTGAIFIIPLLISVWLLDQTPPPTAADEAQRTKRLPMNASERRAFFLRFAPGLVLLIFAYMFLTAYRDFRDNFLPDIWTDLRGSTEGINFSATEIPISLAVLGVLMLLVFIRNNRAAFFINHLIIALGMLFVGGGTWLFGQGYISDYTWILSTGFGAYIAYIPFNSMLFDRMIAAFRYVSNVGFVMYLADAFGYLGSVGVMFYKDFGAKNLNWLEFFTLASYGMSGVSVLIIAALVYFAAKPRAEAALGKE